MTDFNDIVDQAYRAINAVQRNRKSAVCFVIHMTNVRDMVRDRHTWETYMRVVYNGDNMRTYMFMGLPIAEHSFDEFKDKVLVA